MVIGRNCVRVLDQDYSYLYKDVNSLANGLRNIMTWWGKPHQQGIDFHIHFNNPYIFLQW